MMFDFTELPFFDNHTHIINVNDCEINMKEYMGPLNHGYVDQIEKYVYFSPDNFAGDNTPQYLSDEMLRTVTCNAMVAKTWVHTLADFFDCEESAEAVLAERNKCALRDMKAYSRRLYEDQNIIAVVVDAPHPMGDPIMECFPTDVYRLYQTDWRVFRLIDQCESYQDLLCKFDTDLRRAILEERYIGVKCHVLEVISKTPHYVSAEDAERFFRKAKFGDIEAREEVYMAIFCHMLLLSQEIDFPVHIHTGLTGKVPYKNIQLCDPLCLTELLNDTRFVGSHLVFLHVANPFVRSASVMAQTYPNIWIDFAQVLPWHSVNFPNVLEEAIAFASPAKITCGSGAHTHPELNWLAAKVAKMSMAIVMERAVNNGFISKKQAEETAELMLYKNLQRLYKLN